MANAAIGHRRQLLPNRVGDRIRTKRTAGFSAYHSLMNIDTLIGSNRLLDHSFYRRWEEGQLRDGELSSHASQYSHFHALQSPPAPPLPWSVGTRPAEGRGAVGLPLPVSALRGDAAGFPIDAGRPA